MTSYAGKGEVCKIKYQYACRGTRENSELRCQVARDCNKCEIIFIDGICEAAPGPGKAVK